MKTVLLTGASGFIGRQAIAPLLQEGYEIHAVSSSPVTQASEVHWHAANLLDEKARTSLIHAVRPTHLLHFAWYAQPGKYWTATENLAWVEATLALTRAFAEAGGQRLLVAGTCAEYQWGGHNVCREDGTPCLPATLYGASKHALQQILAAYARQIGLSFAWGRIFSLYGPHEYPVRLVASIINAVLAGEQAKCGSGEVIRDYLHVADVANAFVAVLGSELSGAVNIASGEGIALKTLIDAIGAKLGRPELILRGALPTPASEPPALVADISRLRQTGWQAGFTLDSGLDHTIDWWRQARSEAGR